MKSPSKLTHIFEPSSKKVVTFDFGDTLASTIPSYIERVELAMRISGFKFPKERYMEAYMKADYHTFLRYKELNYITPKSRLLWMYEVLSNQLELHEDTENIINMVKKHLPEIPFSKRILIDGAKEVLQELKSRGYKVALISNNDGKVEQKCEELGIKNLFDIIIDSSNVGYLKPDARIFNHTLSKLGISTSETIHIGDLYGADVLGAKNADIDAIWFNHTNFPDIENTGVIQIKNLTELLNILP